MTQHRVTNRFLNRLHDESLPAGRARLVTPLHYVTPSGEHIEIPKGFETDYASVPSLARAAVFVLLLMRALHWAMMTLWKLDILLTIVDALAMAVIFVAEWLENRDSDMAAVVHDWMYRTRRYPRWKADWILFCAMAATGAPENPMWKRWLFWFNVRLFGWKPWNDDKTK